MTFWLLCSAIILIPVFISCESSTVKCSNSLGCINGICKSGQCDCNDPKYWWGNFCEFCRERHTSKERGNKPVISEGKEKSLPSKCAWLIEIDEPKNNRSIILNVDEFNGTSCGNRRLNIYDGSSVRSPLLAIVSDIISTETRTQERPLLQLRAKSGSAFIVLTGKEEKSHEGDCWFSVTYSFEEECSIKCGSHGLCTEKSSQTCECDVGWMSSNCSSPTCPVPCNDSSCDVNTRKCNCTNGFTGGTLNVKVRLKIDLSGGLDFCAIDCCIAGESCNISDKRSFWSSPVANNQDLLEGVASHGMTIIGNYLWLYGGLSFSKGPLDTLARYNIKENTWEVIQNSSELNQGPSARYGHSLVAFNNSLILFGGICQGVVSSDTWIFDTVLSQWSMLNNLINKPVGVTGHTATVVDNEMIVLFGYNPGQGYVNKIQVLGLVTKQWSFKQVTKSSPRPAPAYGHTSVYDPQTGYIYVHGGYRMFNTHHAPSSDTFYYHPKNNKWHILHSSGVPRYLHSAVLVGNSMIVYGGRGQHGYPSQHLMVFDVDKKNWKVPSDSVILETVSRYGHSAVEVNNSVMYAFGGFRGNMMNSFLLYSLGDCLSPGSSLNCFKPSTSYADTFMSHNPQDDPCHRQQSCKQCMSVESEDSCLWCESHNQCVSKAFYNVTFPYLQCMQVLERGTGTCPGLQCSEMMSCRDCHLLPGCGWCDDGSGTGIGRCMPGGNDGPFSSQKNSNSSDFTCSLFTPQTCSKPHWNFIGCPACQCNGHSKCIRENSCKECQNNTTGTYCEKCARGYYGDPKNGCKCSACQCTAHAKSEACDSSTGNCQCVTMGVKGANCDECDTSQDYYGNASVDGCCYFSFHSKTFMTFNLTGLKRLSFEYYPRAIKRSVKLEIKWTKESVGCKARVNLTTFFAVAPEDGEDVVYEDKPVTTHETFGAVFHYHDYEFDHDDKFGVHGYVYDVESTGKNAILTISISQPAETIDLLEFFLTFFGCFLSLLFVAGIVWKVRNGYVNFILNRQRREERQKMASRPFAKVRILLHDDHKSFPGNIAVETLENSKASVLTVLMQLPGTEDGFAPIGQSGICFASVLGTHGDTAGTIPSGKATLIRTRKRCNGTCV